MNGLIAYSMYGMGSLLKALFRDRRGATAIEYGLIVALIVLAMVASLQAFSDSFAALYELVRSKVLEVLGG